MRLATDVVLDREVRLLQERASGLGHELSPPEHDTEVSVVTECVKCETVFGVDGQERPYQFGKLDVPCTMLATLIL